MLTVTNPFSGEKIATLQCHSTKEVKNICAAAKLAQKHWAKKPYSEKNEIITNFRNILKDQADTCAKILSSEMGKPLHHAKYEITASLDRIDWFLEHTPKTLNTTFLPVNNSVSEHITYEPLGVVACISAWNYPYFVGLNIIIPALLTGNSVVYKPSELTPLTGQKIEELLHSSGVNHGIFSSIIGAGGIGEALCQQEIDAVFFTGSYKTGAKIFHNLPSKLIKVGMELGGKDSAYVTNDCDIEKTAATVADACFFNAGQSCCAVERIYVHEEVYDEFCTKFKNFVLQIKYGSPLEHDTYMGPLARFDQIKFLNSQIEDALAKGAKILAKNDTIPSSGQFFPATALCQVDHSMDIMKEESFGPIIGIQKVSSDQEALQLMNDSEYGLTASVHCRDENRAQTIMNELQVGTVYLNCCDRVSVQVPWSGRKHSGIGQTLSFLGIQSFVNPKSWQIKSTDV